MRRSRTNRSVSGWSGWFKKLFRTPKQTPGGRWRSHRWKPLLEVLEDRTAPVVQLYDVGGLAFFGDFNPDQDNPDQLSTDTFQTGTPVQVGLSLFGDEEFKPLLQIDGHVFIPNPDAEVESNIFQVGDPTDVASTISLYLDQQVPLKPVIWSIQDDVADFDARLLSGQVFGGLSLEDAGELHGLTVASIPTGFLVQEISFDNPNGGETDDAVIDISGQLGFDSLPVKIKNLQVGADLEVSGSNIQLVSVDGTIKLPSFKIGEVGVTGFLKVDYDADGEVFSFSGGAEFESEGLAGSDGSMLEITVGTASDPGMKISGGSLEKIEIGFTGEFKAFGLLFAPDDLTFEYNLDPNSEEYLDFIMHGDLTVKVPNGAASDDGATTTTMTGHFGTAADPGLIIDTDTGKVKHVNVAVSGTINVLGFKLESPDIDPVHFVYDADDDLYELFGEVTATKLFSATVIMGTPEQPGIKIKEGKWHVDQLLVGLSDVQLGAFTLQNLDVIFSQTGPSPDQLNKLEFEFFLEVVFPGGWDVQADIDMLYHEDSKEFRVKEVFLEWKATTDDSRIPIANTGLYLTEIDATLDNLNKPSDLIVSGDLTVEYGKKVALFGKSSTFFSAVGGFTVDRNHLELDAHVYLGSFTSTNGGKPSGVLGEGTGKLLLDWHDGIYSLDWSVSLVDGIFTMDGKLEFTDSFQIWISADAKVKFPHQVPFIGGKTLGSLDFRLSYDHKNLSQSYVAAWTKINLGFTKTAIGIEYAFDKKELKIIGGHAINHLSKDPFSQQNVTVYSQDFEVPAGATSATFSVNFPANAGSQAISVTPPGGTEIMEKDFNPSTNGISRLTSQDSPTSINISLRNPGDTSNPPRELLPPGTYTIKLYSTNYAFANPSAEIVEIVDDGNGNTEIKLLAPATGIRVNDLIAVTGNTTLAGGSTPYNTNHTVTAIRSDGSLVTDQLFDASTGIGVGGEIRGWQLPQFSATFYNPPPTIEFTAQPPQNPSTEQLAVTIAGFVDPAFAGTTRVDLYVDRDPAGYDGVLLQSQVPFTLPIGSFTTSEDIGNVGPAGAASFSNGVYTLQGSGEDIWNTSDGFHFLHTDVTGDAEIIARVTSVQNTDEWVKAGVMFRGGTAADAPFVMLLQRPDNQVYFEWRDAAGQAAAADALVGGTSEVKWLRLQRTGNTFTASYSTNGTSWTTIGSHTTNLPSTARVGLAVTSHNNGTLAEAVFDNVGVTGNTVPNNFTGVTDADISGLFTGQYYLYLVINDGTNTPVFSHYTSGFRPPQAVQGSVTNQNGQPLSGWQVFADLNQDGIYQYHEPLSGPSNTDGAYHILPNPGPLALADIKSIKQDLDTGNALIQLDTRTTGFNDGLRVGNQIVITGSSVAAYNTVHTIVAISDTPGLFTTDVTYSGDTTDDGATASMLVDSVPINTPFDLVLINPAPAGPDADGNPVPSDFDTDGTTVVDETYDGSNAASVNFTVQEYSVIRGNVFVDLGHDGVRLGQPVAQFDFGTNTSPLETGYTRVSGSTTYTAAQGFGWLDTVGNVDRGLENPPPPSPVSLTRDLNQASEMIFQVDLPNATYHVTLTIGDNDFHHDDVGVFLQGAQVDTVTTAVGQFITPTYTNITVSNGTLTLRMTDLGGTDPNAVINGMSIVRADDPGLAGWTVELVQNGAVVVSTVSGADGSYRFGRPAPGDYTVRLIPQNGSAATYSFEAASASNGMVDDVSGSTKQDQQQGTLQNGASIGTAAGFGIADHANAAADNQVLRLNGTDQYVDVLAGSNLKPGIGAFSFAGWIRVDDPSKSQDIAGMNNPLDPADGWAFRISHSSQTSRRLSVVLREMDSGSGTELGAIEIGAGPQLQANTWYHVAFTYDPKIVDSDGKVSYDAVKIYINGELQTNIIQVSDTLLANSNIATKADVDFNIGARGSSDGTSGFFFGGYLDDVSVWQSTLTPLQILALYHGETSPGYVLSTPSAPATYDVSIAGEFDIKEGFDFGLDKFVAVGGTITGEYLNSQGVLDAATEAPLAGWNVQLMDGNGNVVQTTTTFADGRYVFFNVPTGSYTIEQPIGSAATQEVRAGWRQLGPLDSTLQFAGGADTLTKDGPAAAGDFDMDGHVDVAFYDKLASKVWIYWGQGSTTFASSNSFSVAPLGTGFELVAADITGDGRIDLAVVNQVGVTALLVNQGGSRGQVFGGSNGIVSNWKVGPNAQAFGLFTASQDIGNVGGAAGFADVGGGLYTVTASGTDIWNTSDGFHFVYSDVAGDAKIIARVASLEDTSSDAKAGVMFRDGTAADAKFVALVQFPNKQVALIWRDETGEHAADTSHHGDETNAKYLRLQRSGNTFTASYSVDGVNWTEFASHTTIIPTTARVGLAVTSRNNGTLTTAEFGLVSLNGVAVNQNVTAVGSGDFDGDIRQDLVFSYWDRQEPSNLFTTRLAVLPGSLSNAVLTAMSNDVDETAREGGLDVGYIDDDEYLDVAVFDNAQVTVAYGNGAGGFTLQRIASILPTSTQTHSPIALADIDGDGRLDIAYATFVGDTSVNAAGWVLQTGHRQFGDPALVVTGANSFTKQLIFKDFDGDLRPDLLVFLKNGDEPLRLLTNRGSGPDWFTPYQTIDNSGFAAVIPADVTGNGLLDLVIPLFGDLRVMPNQTQLAGTGIPITLDSESESSGNDLLNGQVSPVYGAVFDDLDGDGVQDPGEPGRPGATVYVDLDQDGSFDAGMETATVTDALGTYALSGLPNGTHHVRWLAEPGRVLTGPQAGFHLITIEGGGLTGTQSRDFGTTLALLGPIPDQTVVLGSSFGFTVALTDAGAARSLTFSLEPGAPNAASIDPVTGAFSWAGSKAVQPGVFIVTVRVVDDLTPTLTQTGTFFVTVTVPSEPGITLENGVLKVFGTDDADTVKVDKHDGRLRVKASFLTNTAKFNPNGINQIEIHLFGGDDRAVIDANVSVPITAYGGDGHDELTGGSGHDLLIGGLGNDRLQGKAGRDQLEGGEGNDSLTGGGGNDILLGGLGDDELNGGNGDDILVGGDGADEVSGNDGRDLLIGGHGGDNLRGNDGSDLLIADFTVYDGDLTALSALMAEWSSDRSYPDRVFALVNGFGPDPNGVQLQPQTTVFPDQDVDTVFGNSGIDLFFAEIGEVMDLKKDETWEIL